MISQPATVPSGSHSMPMHPQSSHMHHQGPPQQHPNQAVHHQAYTSAPGSSHYQVRHRIFVIHFSHSHQIEISLLSTMFFFQKFQVLVMRVNGVE